MTVTLRGSRAAHHVTVTVRTLAGVRRLDNAAHELTVAVTTALGPGWALLEDQLRQELGHDISADLGR